MIGVTIVEFFASLGFEALNSLNLVLLEGLFYFARTFVEDHHKLTVGFANISTEKYVHITSNSRANDMGKNQVQVARIKKYFLSAHAFCTIRFDKGDEYVVRWERET